MKNPFHFSFSRLWFVLALAICLASGSAPALAGGPAFTDANWVSLPGANAAIHTAIVDTNGNLFVGGQFTNLGGVSANYVAEWNGTIWSPLGSGMNNFVTSLALDPSGNLYAGGYFTNAGGVAASCIAKWDGAKWSPLGSGVGGSDPQKYLLPYVGALACDEAGNIFAGGGFDNAGSVSANGIAEWNGTNWSVLGSGMNGAVSALVLDHSGNLFAGGYFTTAGGTNVKHIAKWNGTVWSPLDSGMTLPVYALAFDTAGNLYAGGEFLQQPAPPNPINLAKWNGTTWSALGPGVNGSVYSLAVDTAGNLYAGGPQQFLVTDGMTANNIAKWNGSAWSALGSGLGGPGYIQPNDVASLAFDGQRNLYVVGSFTTAGTNASTNIAKALLTGPLPNSLILMQPNPATNVITYLGTPGNTYALDLTTDLNSPADWMPQATNMASTNNATTAGYVTFTNVSTGPEAFFRIRSVP